MLGRWLWPVPEAKVAITGQKFEVTVVVPICGDESKIRSYIQKDRQGLWCMRYIEHTATGH
jgi:hypothetical protein